MGQPMQVHAVPLEDRAFDSQGRRLPYAKEWPEGHPLARGQKRHVEEKGPFGRSSRRKGSSRATRTTTPAKKENPAIDGFREAWEFDQKRTIDVQQHENASGAQTDGSTTAISLPSLSKEPTQLFLYGFSPDKQYAAIDFYETVSGGIICEDYERKAPNPRFPNTYSAPAPGRALTKFERSLAAQYRGGECWIKVTFDSAEAAERAIHCSPHLIDGHWVYAQEFRGVGPEYDEPILVRKDDTLQASAPTHQPSQTLGPSFVQGSGIQGRTINTLPRSFTSNSSASYTNGQRGNENASLSSSTASSATATATDVSYPNLRNRHQAMIEESLTSSTRQPKESTVSGRQTLRHFPDLPRTNIRPASEAFLPQPSWSEKGLSRLVNTGLIPRDLIGSGPPRLPNGEFNYTLASYYWRFFHWLDITFGTDLCGIKEL
ncbi:MAG: hypothetical protein Q9195_002627 [Heterodermia aff. obscurata]